MESISQFMESDHVRLNKIFSDFQQLKNSDLKKAKEVFLEFESGLKRHILWEEEIIFVLIGDKIKIKKGTSAGKMLSMLSMQHTQIIEFLQHIKIGLENEKQEAEIEQLLLEILQDHNNAEEGIAYPLIDDLLSDDEKENVFSKMKNFPKERYINI